MSASTAFLEESDVENLFGRKVVQIVMYSSMVLRSQWL